MDLLSIRACADEMEKIALLREAVRLGLKDVPGTPRLVMRKRNLLERAAASEKAVRAYERAISDPIKKKLTPVAEKLPESVRIPLTSKSVKPRAAATRGVEMMAADPIGNVASNLVPAPGAFAAYHGAKKGGEVLINKGVQIPHPARLVSRAARAEGKKLRLVPALDPISPEMSQQARMLASA